MPVGFRAPEGGVVLGDTLPARTAAFDALDLLRDVPAAFLYDFGTAGWPDGWSPEGLHPARTRLMLDGIPMDDAATGRPRFDLLPFAFLEPLRLQPARLGTPETVAADLRPFDPPRPLTELRYWTGNTGLQSIYAMHTQYRRRPFLGQPTRFRVFIGYGGHTTDGEYPGSRLRRMTQLVGRLSVAQAGWSLVVTNLHNRRQLGAHGGVLPQPGLGFESIYTRVGAAVRNASARRQTIRNDLSATARARLVGPEPLTATLFWTSQTFRYRQPGDDTLAVKTYRYGGAVHQPIRLGGRRLHVHAEGWAERLRAPRRHALPDTLARWRYEIHAGVRDTLRLGPARLAVGAGVHGFGDDVFPGGALDVALPAGPLRLFAGASYTGQAVARVEEDGFGDFVEGVGAVPAGRVTRGRLGVSFDAGAFDLTAFGFAHRITEALDLFVVADDTVAARVIDQPVRRVGAAIDLGFRRTAQRGLYATFQPTILVMLDEGAREHLIRLRESLPDMFAQARLGARMRLFSDLDLDVSLRGRVWRGFKSRTLHAPTGLLALPEVGARRFPASGTLDLVLVGGLRGATLFLAYENALSGTAVLAGNLLVPVYPLPARRLRFGLFWPILD